MSSFRDVMHNCTIHCGEKRHAAMLKEIATLRSVRQGTVHYPVNWSEGEFSAILDEIERIIMKLGWMT
jgi:hypothetical protein